MNRRNMIAAIPVAAVPLLIGATHRRAFAQTTATLTTPTPAPTGAPLTEAQHRQLTLVTGAFAKETSQVALTQAQNPAVKQFAGYEFAEQTTIAQVLTDQQAPPPVSLDPAHAAALQSLAALAGPAFDREYVRGQLQGHAELLQIQQSFLQGQDAMDTDAVHVAMLARTVIEMHISMLQGIQQSLTAG